MAVRWAVPLAERMAASRAEYSVDLLADDLVEKSAEWMAEPTAA